MFGRRSLLVTPLVVAALSTIGTSASAQDDVDLWHSQFELGFTGATGNTSFSILTASAALERLEQDRFELQISGRVRYGDGNGEVIANDMLGTAKFDWLPNAAWSPFVFGTVSRDVVRNLDGRVQAGGGVKWTFWQPRVRDTSDYVVDIANELSTTLVGQLSLVLTHSFVRQSVPPPGAVPNDQRLGVTLRVRI